jgi:hypothetical protein
VSENMVEEVSLSGHNASFSISIPKRRVWWNTLCTEWFCVHGKTNSGKTNIFSHVDYERKITPPNELCKLYVFLIFSWLFCWKQYLFINPFYSYISTECFDVQQ